MDFEDDDDVFLSNEVEAELEEDLWSSPLMNYSSPFEDYKDLYADIAAPPRRSSSSSSFTSRLPVVFEYSEYEIPYFCGDFFFLIVF